MRYLPALLLLLTLLTGCSSPEFRPAPSLLDDPSPVVHRLAISDNLLIRFPYAMQFDQSVAVRTDGMITPPFIAPLLAAGRPPEDVEEDLRTAYSAFTQQTNLTPAEKVYRIAAGDRLEIRFHQPAELTDTVDVRPDGRISVTLAGALVAEGRTPEELTTDLRAAYAPYVKEPDLVVILRASALGRVQVGAISTRISANDFSGASLIVSSFAEREIFVMGEVTRPSRVPYRGQLTALQAVAAAGGLTPGAKSGGVMVLRRPASGPVVAFRLDLAEDIGGEPGQDMMLRPFDIVVVPKTPIATVAHVMDQYIYQIIPGLRNSSVNFVYNLRKND